MLTLPKSNEVQEFGFYMPSGAVDEFEFRHPINGGLNPKYHKISLFQKGL